MSVNNLYDDIPTELEDLQKLGQITIVQRIENIIVMPKE